VGAFIISIPDPIVPLEQLPIDSFTNAPELLVGHVFTANATSLVLSLQVWHFVIIEPVIAFFAIITRGKTAINI